MSNGDLLRAFLITITPYIVNAKMGHYNWRFGFIGTFVTSLERMYVQVCEWKWQPWYNDNPSLSEAWS